MCIRDSLIPVLGAIVSITPIHYFWPIKFYWSDRSNFIVDRSNFSDILLSWPLNWSCPREFWSSGPPHDGALEPSSPQKRPFRFRGVIKFENQFFKKISIKSPINEHEIVPKGRTKSLHVGPRAPKQTHKRSKVLQNAPPGVQFLDNFGHLLNDFGPLI